MAKKRKEKVEERKKARQESKARVDSIVNPPSFLDKVREMRDSDMSVMSNTDKIDKVDSGIKPITPVSKEVVGINAPDLSSPKGIDDRRYRERGTVEAITPVTPFKTTAAPKGVYSTESATPTPVGKAVAQNPTGIKDPAIEAAKESAKPKTLSDLLAEQRQAAIKEKTDAAKMQKYYALTDAFNALGKMGGVAVGGAIGGNMLDSAPIVADYQPSRGYIDAFERAKQASDRIRAIDDKQFQLAYSKQQRDEDRAYAEKKTREDRAYAEKKTREDRAYQAEQDRISREFQAEQNRLTREWNKAVADEDFTRQAELKKEILDLQNRYAAADDKRSREYLQLQHDLYNTKHPIMFSDGSVMNLSTQQLEDMFENYKGQTVGGVKINKDNFGEVLRKNPQAFADYFKMIGVSSTGVEQKSETPQTTTTAVDVSFPQHISQIPVENMVVRPRKAASQETDLTKKWESSEI